MRNLGKVVHYAKVQLRFQHSQVGSGDRRGVPGGQPGACPDLFRPAALLSSRTPATATWSCSPPTCTSRPMVQKD